jgi:hypothetical protein
LLSEKWINLVVKIRRWRNCNTLNRNPWLFLLLDLPRPLKRRGAEEGQISMRMSFAYFI